jgi:hypothetical protein
MKKILIIFLLAVVLFPIASYAQGGAAGCSPGKTIGELFGYATCIINKTVIPFFITLAIAVFIYGVVKFIMNAENEEERKKGKNFMIYGIISLFVIVSIWGLVNILVNTFGLSKTAPDLPQLPER